MSFPRSLLPALNGFIAGVVLTWAAHKLLIPPPAPAETPSPAEAQVAELRAKLEVSEAQVRRLQAAQATPAPQPAASRPAATPAAGNLFSSLLGESVKTQTERMKTQKVQALKNRLHLNPEQEKRVQEHFDRMFKFTEEATQKILAGERLDPKEMPADAAPTTSEEKMLEEILTPEQLAAYQEMKVEEATARTEMMATVEMSQVAPLLGLDESQKDAFFQAMVGVEQELETPEGRKRYLPAGSENDPLRYFKVRDAAKLEATKAVLDDDQWEAYKKHLDSQGEMQRSLMEAFMPQSSPSPGP